LNDTEEHRHQCEVRHYLALARRQGLGWFKAFVVGWKRWPDSKLQRDFWAQWKAGNSGKHGEWL
jgi:hypothetical protein